MEHAPYTRRTVTLKQVAALAGVHASTVSRALNAQTRSMVIPSVVEKVMKAASELGYRPDPVAASLRTGRSKLIGMLVPDIANSLFAPILSGASDHLSALGYSVIVADVGSNEKRQLDLAAGLASRRVDGLILATVSRDDPLVAFCIEQQLPAVLVNRAEARTRVSAVISDDVLGMELAVSHLVSLGHRYIGHIAGPIQHSTGFLRRRGFQFALTSSGLGLECGPCEDTTAYSRVEGASAMARLIDKHPLVTAIVAANDLLALGAYDVLAARGLKCPDDVSIIGHNDMPLVDLISPALTTIHIDHVEMGRQAAQLLLQAMEQPHSATRNVVMPSELVVRKSTSSPRKP